MTRIAILGGTGYTALELIKLALRHPDVDIVAATSRNPGARLDSVHPHLSGRVDLALESLPPEQLAERVDCVFSCLPHAASASSVKPLVDAGLRVVDFSADYRLNDVATYETWYGGTHPDPDRVGNTPYGLPEFFRASIEEASLVANPGCYPTSAIMALAPLLTAGLISAKGLIVDAKSGVSGAGRNPKLATLFPECNESICAYSVGEHRHGPEIAQILERITGQPADVIFTPHLVPMNRGILTTSYSEPQAGATAEACLEALRACYRDCPFVRVVDHLPHTRDVIHTNYIDIAVRKVGDRILTISSEDNLLKGASGAAMQNFNVMFGYPETTALL